MVRPLLLVSGFFAVVMLLPTDGLVAQEKKKKKPEATGPINPFGMPENFKQGKGPKYAVWFDDGYWHIRATGPEGNKERFTGTVVVAGGRVSVKNAGSDKAKKPGKADWINPYGDGSGFSFNFANFGKADGVDFKSGAGTKAVTFKLLVGGGEDPKAIVIGKDGRHPEKATFSFPSHPDE